MIHLYCGDGKGKTTAAMGLALRALGRDRRVVICQFLKSGDSGERLALERFERAVILPVPEQLKFVFQMDEEEKAQTRQEMTDLFDRAAQLVRDGRCDLLVLDEVCAALTTGMLDLDRVTALLDEAGETEIVLTGRDPAEGLRKRADYITEMAACRHPFAQGKPARLGIEW